MTRPAPNTRAYDALMVLLGLWLFNLNISDLFSFDETDQVELPNANARLSSGSQHKQHGTAQALCAYVCRLHCPRPPCLESFSVDLKSFICSSQTAVIHPDAFKTVFLHIIPSSLLFSFAQEGMSGSPWVHSETSLEISAI